MINENGGAGNFSRLLRGGACQKTEKENHQFSSTVTSKCGGFSQKVLLLRWSPVICQQLSSSESARVLVWLLEVRRERVGTAQCFLVYTWASLCVCMCGWVLGLKKKKNKMSDFSSGVYIHFAPGKWKICRIDMTWNKCVPPELKKKNVNVRNKKSPLWQRERPGRCVHCVWLNPDGLGWTPNRNYDQLSFLRTVWGHSLTP